MHFNSQNQKYFVRLLLAILGAFLVRTAAADIPTDTESVLSDYDCVVFDTGCTSLKQSIFGQNKSTSALGVAINRENSKAKIIVVKNRSGSGFTVSATSKEIDFPGLSNGTAWIEQVERTSPAKYSITVGTGSPGSPALDRFEFIYRQGSWALSKASHTPFFGCNEENDISIEYIFDFNKQRLITTTYNNCKPSKSTLKHIPTKKITLSKFDFSVLHKIIEHSHSH